MCLCKHLQFPPTADQGVYSYLSTFTRKMCSTHSFPFPPHLQCCRLNQHEADPGTSVAAETHSLAWAEQLAQHRTHWMKAQWGSTPQGCCNKDEHWILVHEAAEHFDLDPIPPLPLKHERHPVWRSPWWRPEYTNSHILAFGWMYSLAFSMPETGCPWKLRRFTSIQSILRSLKTAHLLCIIQTTPPRYYSLQHTALLHSHRPPHLTRGSFMFSNIGWIMYLAPFSFKSWIFNWNNII